MNEVPRRSSTRAGVIHSRVRIWSCLGLAAIGACQGQSCNMPGQMIVIPPPVKADYLVLAGRQKYIGLQGYFPGVEYDAVTFSIVTQPASGQLLGTPPNMLYVPNAGFTGMDSFTYQAQGGGNSFQRTVAISVQTNYVPPIGIPPPDFGITQSHTMYAGQSYDYGGSMSPYRDGANGPYTHYVDFENGTDTANPFGTSDLPRRTIPNNLTPGSVVEVHGAAINYAPRITFTGEGTMDKPIFIRGASPTNKAVFRKPVSVEGNFIICENFDFDCQDFGPGVIGPVWFWITSTQVAPFKVFHHIVLRHSLIHDQPTTDQNAAGISVGVLNFDPTLNDPNLLIENFVAYDVEIRNFSTWNDPSGGTDYGGCALAVNTRNSWILDCHFHHLRGDGASASRANAGSNQTPARRAFIGRNYIHNCKENAFDYKNAVDSIFSQNICHTVRVSSSSLGQAVTIHNDDPTSDWPACDNIWIVFNTIYDAEIGIYHENQNSLFGKSSRSFLVGNLVFDVRHILGNPATTGVAIQKGQLAQSRIIGNTIFNCDHGIWMGLPFLTEPDKCTQVVRNNAIFNLTERVFNETGKHGMHLYVTPPTIDAFTTIDHNLHFEEQGQVRINIVALGLQDHDFFTVEDLVAGSGFGTGSIIGDPMLKNVAGLDFHLSPSSPGRLAGAVDDAYTLFNTTFGTSIDFYLDGEAKPATRFDMGALGDGE